MKQLAKRGLEIGESLRGMHSFELSVPGNILLMGEYAVLEEGGAGIALAVERRATVRCRKIVPEHRKDKPSGYNELHLTFASGAKQEIHRIRDFSGGSPETPEMVRAVIAALNDAAKSHNAEVCPEGPWECTINTSAFYDNDGRKLGLGSSAAACLLLTAAIAQIAGFAEDIRREVFADIAPIAVRAHRLFQGGKGSGYDVLCSFLGGVSLFRGGKNPDARRLGRLTRSFPRFLLYSGYDAVRTVSAIGSYRKAWDTAAAEVRAYIRGSTLRAFRLSRAKRHTTFADCFKQARLDGIAFGNRIGVNAELPPPAGIGLNVFYKAVGAGNETGIAFPLPKASKHGSRFPESVAVAGLTVGELYRAEARGKLLLFGEHAAVYGYPACGIGLEQTSAMRFVEIAADSATFADAGESGRHLAQAETLFPALPPQEAHIARAALQVALEQFPDLLLPNGYFEYESTIPQSGGFGSSAAVSVALTRLLARLAGEVVSENEVWKRANAVDSYFHGKASGIDTGLSMRNGLWSFNVASFSAKALRCKEKTFYLVCAAVPRAGTTKNLVAGIRETMNSPDGKTSAAIATLGTIAKSAQELLDASPESWDGKKTLSLLGAYTNHAHRLLGDLCLSTEALDFLLHVAIDAGSPGAKLSGAGGGGAFYAWATSYKHAVHLAATIRKRASDAGITLSQNPICIVLSPGSAKTGT